MAIRAALLIAIVALLVVAGRADAATMSYENREVEGYKGSTSVNGILTYSARPGEVNQLAVESTDDAVVFRDAGAPIDPGSSGCEPIESGAVRCSRSRQAGFREALLSEVDIDAGDGDDTVRGRADVSSLTLRGGTGDDVLDVAAAGAGEPVRRGAALLEGGDGDDQLVAGPDGDALRGGPGRDRLLGGDGADRMTGDGPGAAPADDVIDGGRGVDSVSYEERTAPVAVDLADPAPDGGAGEADVLAGVEELIGGFGADRLAGDDRRNSLMACFVEPEIGTCPGGDVLVGRGGDDVLWGSRDADRTDGGAGRDVLRGFDGADLLRGGPGDDLLSDGRGADRLDGGAGDDRLDVTERRPLERDRIACGSGRDRVDDPDGGEAVAPDCEAVRVYGLSVELRPRRVTVRASGSGCRVRLGLRARGRPAVRLGFVLKRWQRTVRRLPFAARGAIRVDLRLRRCGYPFPSQRANFTLRRR